MGLKEDIEEIKRKLDSQQEGIKEKKFRFPLSGRVGKGMRKKNYVTILSLNENGSYNFKKYQIEDQTILHENIPRLATAGHVLFDNKGNPMIILPSWSVEPFSPLQHFTDSLKNGNNIKGYQILLAKMKKEVLDGKKKIGSWVGWIIGAGLVGIIIYAFITGGAK